jgi:hypothetical protein
MSSGAVGPADRYPSAWLDPRVYDRVVRRLVDRFVRVLACWAFLSAPAIITGVAAALLARDLAVVAIMLVAFVAGVVAVERLVDWSATVVGVAAACGLFACFVMIFASQTLVLRLRGERTEATVAAELVSPGHGGDGPTYSYRLTAEGGRPIRGELSGGKYDRHSVGDRLAIVFDPRGVADPVEPEDLSYGVPLAAVALGLLVTVLVLCVPATAESRTR